MLENLYLQHYRELYVYVYAMCGQKALTEDILQETFLKAFTALKDSHTNMRAWLYLVARNLCFNAMKKESRTESLENSGQEPENGCKSGRNPLEEILGNEEKNRLGRKGKSMAHRNLCAIAVYDFDRGVSGDLDAVYGDQIPSGALRHAAGNYSG